MGKRKAKRHGLKNGAAGGMNSRKPPKPTLPEIPWDVGAAGPANRDGLVIEERGEIDPATGKRINPNGVKGARRVDMLEVWHRRGTISTAGYNAAITLRDAFEGTMRAPGWNDNDRVQSSPKPDQAVTMQIDRISRFHAIYRLVPAADRAVIDYCILRERTHDLIARFSGPGYKRECLPQLGPALDRLADAMAGRRRPRLARNPETR